MGAPVLVELAHEAAIRHVGPQIPGLVALVSSGAAMDVESLGEMSVGGPPMRRDALFRIASISKPITAATTLALVDDGLLRLDDPVAKWLPELAQRRVLVSMDAPLDQTVPANREIVVRDLLNFTFGFGFTAEMFTATEPWPVARAADELGLASLGPPQPATPPDPDTWIERFGTLPLMAQPGERWFYNTGAQVLSVLIRRVSGKPLPQVMHERLFVPLGMNDTGFHTDQIERLATSYVNTPEGLVVWDPPDGLWSEPQPFPDGAAGLLCTVDDLHAFSRMLLSGGAGVLSPESVEAMTSDQLTAEQRQVSVGLGRDFFATSSWGFCQSVDDNGSYGWNGGLGTSWRVDPRHDLVVIVFTQRMFDSPDPPQVHKDMLAAAYAAVA